MMGVMRHSRALLALMPLLLFMLAGCGRVLTENETQFLSGIHGPDLNTRPIRFHRGNPGGRMTIRIPVRPRTTCQERIWPPQTETRTVTVSPGATAVFHHVLFRTDLYRDDYMDDWPESFSLVDAMLLAHEATHIWQWQNRDRTGYTPLKALREHVRAKDPYLFDQNSAARRFLDFGYEQQGSIVEEYVCCRVLDPDADRTHRLRAMLEQDLPVARLDDLLANTKTVQLPWSGLDPHAICSEPELTGRSAG